MKKEQCNFAFLSFTFFLFIFLFSINPEAFSRTVTYDVQALDFTNPIDTDTVLCADEFQDTLQTIVVFDHEENGVYYYLVKLSRFHSEFERLLFYTLAGERGIFIADKNEYHNDAALFITKFDDEQARLAFRDILQREKEVDLSTSDSAKMNFVRSSPFHYPADSKQTNGPGPPGPVPCDGAKVACSANTYSFPAGTIGYAPDPVAGYPNYGCLGKSGAHYAPGPAWYFMQVGVAGNIVINISASSPIGATMDVDFVCWGPFPSLTDGCGSGLTGTCNIAGQPNCCNNNDLPTCANFYPRGNITDCSFSTSATETCHISNAQVGEMYILLLSNWNGNSGIITFSQTGGSGVTNCNIVSNCSIIAITSNPTGCDLLTNTFSVNGNIEFTNPLATGTLTITDNTAVPPVSQTFVPPLTSPLPYNLTNIPCDGAVHSLTAVFSDNLSCTLTKQFTSPAPTCPQAHISGGGSICNDGIHQATVSVDFPVGMPPYTFIYAINGISQTAITHNSNTPYQLSTTVPGTYTLVSVSNQVCSSGSVSGSATVIVNPIPNVSTSVPSPVTICSGATAQLALSSTVPGTETVTSFAWTASGNASTIIPVPSGISGNGNIVQMLSNTGNVVEPVVFHIMPTTTAGCSPATPTDFIFNVNPVPSVTTLTQGIPSTEQSVCSGSSTWPVNLQTNVSGPAVSYNWTNTCDPGITNCPPASGNSNPIPVFAPVNPTTTIQNIVYSIVASVNAGSGTCPGPPASYTVHANPLPVSSFTGSTTVCQLHPDPYLYPANTGPACSYTWSISPASSGSIANANVSPASITWNNPGTATLRLDAYTGIGCTSFSSAGITINPKPDASMTSCSDLATSRSAKRFLLKGGLPVTPTQGEYLVTPASPALVFDAGNYYFDPSLVPGNSSASFNISYKYTSSLFGCPAIAPTSIAVSVLGANPPCGTSMIDYRDNTTYQTADFNGICWMTENLRYGAPIAAATPQSDNCITEKYCESGDCTSYGALYQWDELIQYGVTAGPAYQGVCPPGWHVPSQLEWQDLINAVSGSSTGTPGDGIAGSYLLDPNQASGFHALLNGVYYLNNTWAFTSGNPLSATMFWTSTTSGSSHAVVRGLNNYTYSVSFYLSSRANAFPVRCVKD